MPVSHAELDTRTAEITTWVTQIRAEHNHRIHQLERQIGHLMTLVDDNRTDLASLSGAVSDIEGLLIQQETQINALTATVTESVPEHQALVETHAALTGVVQSLRDAVTAATPPPVVVPPAPDVTTTPAPGTAGGAVVVDAPTDPAGA